MLSKILKRVLLSVLIIILALALLLSMPRLWSAVNPHKPPVGYHFISPAILAILTGLEPMTERFPQIPSDIEVIKNIEYKNIGGKSLQLDIYRPKKLAGSAPLVVFIHGGGWRSGHRQDYFPYLIDFAKQGYITATVSYRLLKDGPYPACVEDIHDAVAWFSNHGQTYGYDPNRIALVGGSAGAHLAMLVAYGWKQAHTEKSKPYSDANEPSHRIKAVVDFYGPTDLTTEYGRNHRLVTSFIAHPYTEMPQLYREASPIQYVNKDNPATLILHGTSDTLVPISQADALKQRLDACGVPCVLHRLPLWPHTMDIVKRVNVFCELKMGEFFKRYLQN